MTSIRRNILIALGMILFIALAFAFYIIRGNPAELPMNAVTGTDPVIADAVSEEIPTFKLLEPSGWSEGAAPTPAKGLQVARFAEGLDHPRSMLTLPNGDVLVAETNSPPRDTSSLQGKAIKYGMDKVGAGNPSANRITLLRDSNGDGVADKQSVLLKDLNSPFGMVYDDGTLYVANTDSLVSVPFETGQTKIDAAPKKLMDLPGGGFHWARNLVLDPTGKRIYIGVGSATNIGTEDMKVEQGRAAIYEYDIAKGKAQLFGSGMRNPTGLAFNPDSGELWTTVNERDMLGSDGPPDYLTNVPIGVQYGWPWLYWRFDTDNRVKAPMPQYLTEYTRYPEYSLGPHVSALGLVFADGSLGANYRHGAFVARHGSWNRKPVSGYDVVFVAFDDRGNPLKKLPQPVLTGFLDGSSHAHGRPTMLAWDKDGALLVSDDTAGIIWRVTGQRAGDRASQSGA